MSPALRAPAFWWQPAPSPLARALWPLGAVYGAVAGRRLAGAPRARAGVPVLCIGNFVAGGAGKTPTALAMAEALAASGERPVFLTRGYGGTLGRQAPVLVDPARHGAGEVGDEALLLAARHPVVVAADRAAGARLAAPLGTLIVMDDGFQNPALEKTLSLVLADAETGIGNGLCLPAGPLRAPLAAQLARADAVVLIGRETAAGTALRRRAEAASRPVFAGRLAAEPGHGLAGRRVLAFAGIGRPDKFFATLAGEGAEVVAARGFPDHHRFSAGEAAALLAQAQRDGLVLVTTEKDFARLGGGSAERAAERAAEQATEQVTEGGAQGALARLAAAARVLRVRLVPDEPDALFAFVRARIAAARSG